MYLVFFQRQLFLQIKYLRRGKHFSSYTPSHFWEKQISPLTPPPTPYKYNRISGHSALPLYETLLLVPRPKVIQWRHLTSFLLSNI